jgi:TRAP-type C4-dicarboxylate transport system permease small subunit
MFQKIIDCYCTAIGYLIAAAMALMVLLVFGNVVLRYGFNSGFTLSEELSRWLFVWLTFLGAVAALRDNAHLGTDMLVGKLGPLGKRICMGLSLALMLYCLWLLFKGSYDQFKVNVSSTSAVMEASMGWIYAAGMAFAILGAPILLQDLYRLVTGKIDDDHLMLIQESEESSHERHRRNQTQPLTTRPGMTVIVFLGSLMAAMALGVPIAFSLLLCGVALMVHMGNFDAQILAQNLLEGANSFPLLAVPFFMLAGEIMNAGGLSRRIVNFAMALVGHVKGGLGYVTIVAAVIMASLSGSAVADAAALAALLLPMMVAAGHDKSRSAGLIAAGGIIAPIIPPSIGFVVFGVAGNVSISKLFMAGIFPGVWLALALVVTWWWLVRSEQLTPPPRKSVGEVLEALRLATWALGIAFHHCVWSEIRYLHTHRGGRSCCGVFFVCIDGYLP